MPEYQQMYQVSLMSSITGVISTGLFIFRKASKRRSGDIAIAAMKLLSANCCRVEHHS